LNQKLFTVCELQLARLLLNKNEIYLSTSSTSTATACKHSNKVISQYCTVLLYSGKTESQAFNTYLTVKKILTEELNRV